MKSIEDQFCDWENYTFGFGYGTGEQFTIPALQKFLELCNEGCYKHSYNHEKLEEALTPTVAWLLINILCQADIIEYGTSPRYAWLSPRGKKLKEFVCSKSIEELYQITIKDNDYNHCQPDCCNCGPTGYQEGATCNNLFWNKG